jgi:hypothetical protein
MKLIIPFLFLLFINFAFGQDYRQAKIIFNDSTSIKGFGEIKNNEIYFKVKQEDKPTKWSYDITKGLIFYGYGFSEKYEYIKCDKHSKPKILEVIEEGNVTLYKDSRIFYTGNFTPSIGHLHTNISSFENISETFYVKRESEEFATNIFFSFKTSAKKYFSDCLKIIEQINNRKFTKENIPDMVFYYNEYCSENED